MVQELALGVLLQGWLEETTVWFCKQDSVHECPGLFLSMWSGQGEHPQTKASSLSPWLLLCGTLPLPGPVGRLEGLSSAQGSGLCQRSRGTWLHPEGRLMAERGEKQRTEEPKRQGKGVSLWPVLCLSSPALFPCRTHRHAAGVARQSSGSGEQSPSTRSRHRQQAKSTQHTSMANGTANGTGETVQGR